MLTHYERSEAERSGDGRWATLMSFDILCKDALPYTLQADERSEANRSRNSVIFLPLAATELGKFPMKFSLKKFLRKLIYTGK